MPPFRSVVIRQQFLYKRCSDRRIIGIGQLIGRQSLQTAENSGILPFKPFVVLEKDAFLQSQRKFGWSDRHYVRFEHCSPIKENGANRDYRPCLHRLERALVHIVEGQISVTGGTCQLP